jgi:predicted acetyltransferase
VPHLVAPTTAVRASYIAGEGADVPRDGAVPEWLDHAEADFDAFVARRRAAREMWEVPITELWYVDGETYLGTLVIRHRLTPRLRCEGGHIGYNVVSAHRRRGHATAMLAESFGHCRALGLKRLLVTCDADNLGSRRVIEANGGRLRHEVDGIRRYWIILRG